MTFLQGVAFFFPYGLDRVGPGIWSGGYAGRYMESISVLNSNCLTPVLYTGNQRRFHFSTYNFRRLRRRIPYRCGIWKTRYMEIRISRKLAGGETLIKSMVWTTLTALLYAFPFYIFNIFLTFIVNNMRISKQLPTLTNW